MRTSSSPSPVACLLWGWITNEGRQAMPTLTTIWIPPKIDIDSQAGHFKGTWWPFRNNVSARCVHESVLFIVFLFFLFFSFCFLGCSVRHGGSKFPNQGWNPCPLHWECGVLTTGLPGESLFVVFWWDGQKGDSGREVSGFLPPCLLPLFIPQLFVESLPCLRPGRWQWMKTDDNPCPLGVYSQMVFHILPSGRC